MAYPPFLSNFADIILTISHYFLHYSMMACCHHWQVFFVFVLYNRWHTTFIETCIGLFSRHLANQKTSVCWQKSLQMRGGGPITFTTTAVVTVPEIVLDITLVLLYYYIWFILDYTGWLQQFEDTLCTLVTCFTSIGFNHRVLYFCLHYYCSIYI